MKTVSGIFACLFILSLTLSVVRPGNGASNERTSLQAFGDNCAKARIIREGANGLSYFKTLYVGGNEKYPVDEYKVISGHPDTQKIVVWIGKGKDGNLEIPRITDICLDGKTDPDVGTDPGDIIFYSKPGHSVEVLFHLNGLQSGWKAPKAKKTKASDSIWMVTCQGTCTDDLHPNRKDWPPPSCAAPKEQNVKVAGSDMSFTMCSNSGGTDDDNYVYEIHMDQVGLDNIGVDVSIDPKIINHPS
jgi:hypothetical protein